MSAAQDSCSHAGSLAVLESLGVWGAQIWWWFLKVSLLDIAVLAMYPCLFSRIICLWIYTYMFTFTSKNNQINKCITSPWICIVQAEIEQEHHLFPTGVQDGARSQRFHLWTLRGFRSSWIVNCKLLKSMVYNPLFAARIIWLYKIHLMKLRWCCLW